MMGDMPDFKPGQIIVIPDGSDRLGCILQKNYSERRVAGRPRTNPGPEFEEWYISPLGTHQTIELHRLKDGDVEIL